LLLGLPLADPGFDSTMLSEFRSRLVTGAAEMLLLDAVLEIAATHRLLKAGGRQRTDSTHVLAAARCPVVRPPRRGQRSGGPLISQGSTRTGAGLIFVI
jgi:hypothetical protein